MKKSDAEQLIALIQRLAAPDGDRPLKAGEVLPVRTSVEGKQQPPEVTRGAKEQADRFIGAPTPAAVDFEVLYQKIKRRLLDDLKVDPVFVKLLATQPEIMIEIEPRVVELDGSSVRGRTARLIAAGWFKESRATFAVRKELGRTGSDPGGGGALAGILGDFVRDGFLMREGDGWLAAPGIKISEKVIEAR